MKKSILYLLSLFAPFYASAQLYPDGSTVPTMPFLVDINGNLYDTEAIADSGKHSIFFVFVSHTSILPWSYFNTETLQNYYGLYGPQGTEDSSAHIFMYEIDPQSVDSQIYGQGNSLGDWTAGHSIPIMNNCCEIAMFGAFVDPSSPMPSFVAPSVFVVCSDKKMYNIGPNVTTAQGLRDTITQVCAIPSAVRDVDGVPAQIAVAPNPVKSQGQILLHLKKSQRVSYSISDLTGKTVFSSEEAELNSGEQTLHFNCASWTSGMYIARVKVGQYTLTAKVMVP